MIISITFPSSSSSSSTNTPHLPPALAQISHSELVLIELQGALEVECTSDRERDGRLVGRLCVDDAGKKPTLMIGHHLLEGKVAQLPKPLAVLRRVSAPNPPEADADDDAMDCHDPDVEDGDNSQLVAAANNEHGERERETVTVSVSWDAIAVIKRKIVFSKRPMPIVGRPQV
ncbi:Ctf8-domain-containing protein [Mycena filopes]|nr:Ctf8-domain-containing protein [Mycena filopes]